MKVISNKKLKRNLWIFNFVFKSIKKKMIPLYGESFSKEIQSLSRKNLLMLLPELPYVGGIKNYFSPIVHVNGWIIASYQAMREKGKTAEDLVCIWAEVADDLFLKMPHWLTRLAGKALLSNFVIKGFSRQANLSQERIYTEDWVYKILDGDSENYKVGFEFSECAVIKLYKKLDTMELAPYCNFADATYGHYLGLGLSVNETLGLGNECCQMLFNPGAESPVPENLLNILPRAI